VAADHAQLRASINLAIQTYQASGKTDADKAAFAAAINAARTTYATDSTVVAARATR